MDSRKTKAIVGPRTTLILIVALVAAPLVIAWVLVMGPAEWRPAGRVNHGDLVIPPLSLKDAALVDLEGNSIGLDRFLGKWNLVYVGEATCEADCEAALYAMRQVRLAMGKNMARVQRVYITQSPDPAPALRTVLMRYPGLLIITGQPEALHAFRRQFASSDGGEGIYDGGLAIVDPLGNLMMRYAPDADPSGLLKDLERLLRASRVG